MVMAVTQETMTKALTGKLVILALWAPWCGPCKALAPILEALEQELPLKVLTMNVDQDARVAERFGVQSVPTMIVYRDGKPYEKITGVYPKAQLRDHFEQVLADE